MDSQEIVLKMIKKCITFNGHTFVNPDFIETNSAIIVFVDNIALKILKQGRPGVDCSTALARLALLREEFETNFEISSNLYFGIKPIFMQGEQIFLGENNVSDSKAVDYGLCMKKLKQKSLVYNKLSNRSYRDEYSVLIAKTIALFHKRKLLGDIINNDCELIDKFGTIESFANIIKGDFEIFEKLNDVFVPKIITKNDYQEIKQSITTFFKKKRELFLERIKSRYVLPIHGDFHSRNIFVEDNNVYIIDRSLRRNMRVGDIIKDVAYFAVDLEMFNYEKQKMTFLDAYHSIIKDEYSKQLLPFYMCRRAFVAGITNLYEEDIKRLRAYFALSHQYATIL